MRTALQALALITQINRIPFDSKEIINKFALNTNEPSIDELTRIAKYLEFKAKIKNISEISKYKPPFIAQSKQNTYFVIFQILEDGSFLIYDGGSSLKKINKMR